MKRLRALDRGCGDNKHHRVTVLICACIDEGVNTGPMIVATIRRLGFCPRHVGKLLHDGKGNHPGRHWWARDPSGVYRNLA